MFLAAVLFHSISTDFVACKFVVGIYTSFIMADRSGGMITIAPERGQKGHQKIEHGRVVNNFVECFAS